MKTQKLFAWFLMIVVPALILSAYIYSSRMTRSFSPTTDYLALAVSVTVGVAGVLMLVRPPKSRWLAILLYVVITGVSMHLGMVSSLCYLGDCP